MSILTQGAPTPGNFWGVFSAGAPTNGTNEVQTLTMGAGISAGTFKLQYDGLVTAAITWSATNATLLSNINTALTALPSVGTSGFAATAGTLTAGIGTILLTAGGNLAKLALTGLVTVADSSLTGGTATGCTESTPGVTATARGCIKGTRCLDTTNGVWYQNTGTALVPVWVLSTPLAVQSSPGAIGTTTNLTAVPGSFADVAAVQTYLAGANVVPRIESRLDVVEAKIDAVTAALVTAGIFV